MLFSVSSLMILGLGVLAIVLPHLRAGSASKMLSDRAHRVICAVLFAAGCFVRLYQLGSLPYGISAEEALVGVQAKALWQTGGFLFEGGLTAQLSQWAGESAGPLLAVLTAPFVGLFGMTAWTTRLPLALLSCAAMPAMYGLGNLIGGKRAARWCLAAYAICPYFVLAARMTAAGNMGVFLLPIALYGMLCGMKKPAALYIGMALMGLMAYTQNMYFFIAPAAVLLGSVFAVLQGMKKRHAMCAGLLGMVLCLPAILTLWVNLGGGEEFTLLGMIRIPALESFDKRSVSEILTPGQEVETLRNKFWAVITGAVFQVLQHLNISAEMFAPKGLGALYILSVPLMGLGAFSLIHDLIQGRRFKKDHMLNALLMLLIACVSVLYLVLYGSDGALDVSVGYSNVFDYASILLFDVLLMAAGLCHMERKSAVGTGALGALLTASFVILCVHLLGGNYRDNTNVYFTGFGELAKKAESIREDEDTVVNVTGTVYPHFAPSDAAEMMYLYATDADMKEVLNNRRGQYDVIYAPGIENPDRDQIYLVTQGDIASWDLSGFQYEDMGEYALLTPLGE